MKPPAPSPALQQAMQQSMQQAERAFDAGDWNTAAGLCRRILDTNPDFFYALNLLGVIAAQSGRLEEAADLFARAAAANPRDAAAHSNTGNVLKELGRLDEALAHYDRAIRLNSKQADAYNNRGVTLQELGRGKEALASYGRAIALQPGYADAHNNRGVLLRDMGRADESLASYDRAIKFNPAFAEAHNNRGNLLAQQGRTTDALAAYDAALHLNPKYAEAQVNRAAVLREMGRADAALAGYDAAIAIKPAVSGTHLGRSLALRDLGRLDEARAAAEHARDLAPDSAQAHGNLGNILKQMARWDAALASFDHAIALQPDLADTWNNLGVALQELNRLPEAIASFERAAALNPDYNNARWNLSFCRLLTGDFAKGWDGFDRRWEDRPTARARLHLAPDWNGQRLDGSLLVLNEQGVGDEIFYSGMLNDLRPLARKITVCVDPRLVALYRRSFDGIDVICPGDLAAAGPFDAQIYMGDLGAHLRRGPEPFAGVRPYLHADAAQTQALRDKIHLPGHVRGRQLCGLSWVSKSPVRGVEKSLRLIDLRALLARPDMAFVDLQYGDTRAEQDDARAQGIPGLITVPEVDNFNDLDGLAALISACDRVITVSNTTAHLAAALGKPVIVLLSYSPGLLWYWHIDRVDSPWYPTVRLLRQETAGDWGAMAARLGAALTPPG